MRYEVSCATAAAVALFVNAAAAASFYIREQGGRGLRWSELYVLGVGRVQRSENTHVCELAGVSSSVFQALNLQDNNNLQHSRAAATAS
jgi:hypothetical protein